MQAYLHKRPAQLAAFIAEQRRFAKLGAAPDFAPYKLFDMDFAGLEQRIRAAPPATWGMNAPRLKLRTFYPADFGEFANTTPLTPAPQRLAALLKEQMCNYYDGGSVDEFKFLGAGCYAAVFQHPEQSNQVIKIGRSSDDGWLGYARWCVANQGKPMVPKIYELRRVVDGGRVAYYAVLEKLAPLVEENKSWDAKSVTESRTASYWAEQLSQLRRFVSHRCDDAYLPDSRRIETLGRSLYAAFGANNMDLHTGNAMLNSMGELVITDPYTLSDGTTTKDLPA